MPQLELMKILVCEHVNLVTDHELLDLILKLLVHETT